MNFLSAAPKRISAGGLIFIMRISFILREYQRAEEEAKIKCEGLKISEMGQAKRGERKSTG